MQTGELSRRISPAANPEIYKKVTLHLETPVADKDRCSLQVSEKVLDEIEPLALQVIKNTEGLFNAVCHHAFSLDETISKISHLTFAASEEDVLLAAWHEVDRKGAEKLLRDSARGTFLFRRDEFAVELEKNINHKCFTLTYLNSNQQVVDKTIAQKGKKNYQFYDDDPKLGGKKFPSLKALISSLGDHLMIALPVEA